MSLAAATVFAVTSMHEEVYERACQQKQIRKNAEQVCPMFCEKEEANDSEKYDQHHAPSRAEPTAIF
jgi:hypothetical protein